MPGLSGVGTAYSRSQVQNCYTYVHLQILISAAAGHQQCWIETGSNTYYDVVGLDVQSSFPCPIQPRFRRGIK